jgi:hypothetical protein
MELGIDSLLSAPCSVLNVPPGSRQLLCRLDAEWCIGANRKVSRSVAPGLYGFKATNDGA